MSLHRNRVQMTVTGAPGAGTITLNAATTGYQSFSSAYGADATVDILITEGNNWEVCRNCAYTNGTPQVDRGTLEGSSAGPTTRVSFGSGAIVSVIATAAAGNNWGLNEIQASPTSAGVTGVVGTLHILDISGLTASQDFTLPATCAVGDRVGVFIKTGDPDYELLLKPASGDTINGGSPAAEWSRLFISNECVIFRCITANQDWIVEYDGRIAAAALIIMNQDADGEGANVYTLPTSCSTPGAWTTTFNRDLSITLATGRITARRSGKVNVAAGFRTKDTPTAGTNAIVQVAIQKNGSNLGVGSSGIPATLGGATVAFTAEAATGDYFQMAFSTSVGGLGARGTEVSFLSISEVLP